MDILLKKVLKPVLKKVLKKVKKLKKTLKKVNSLKKSAQKSNKKLPNFFYKVKYLLQKLLDNSELWLKALLSSIEGGFQLKKTLDRHAGPIVAASGKRGCTV